MLRYRPDILERLERFGIFPRPHTDPVLVRDFVKSLHTMEIRTMRVEQQRRERAGDTSGRKAYRDQVVALRARYDLLSIPVQWWTEPE